MTRRRLHLPSRESASALRRAFAEIRQRYDVPTTFPSAVEQEASEAASWSLPTLRDLTDLPFVTVDPVGSHDLDQALYVARRGSGYTVQYAIADVPHFVAPGGALDAEARNRGNTVYLPDGSEPLHPRLLSEGAASLLPGQTRPAFVWTLQLDQHGELTSCGVERALVKSRHQYDYLTVHRLLEAGQAPELFSLLRVVGQLRIERERARGGASLTVADQEVHQQDGHYVVQYRPVLPVEEWNAQISLLTGMAAAFIMMEGNLGILRTMPEPASEDVEEFRTRVVASGVEWPEGLSYAELLRTLDRGNPRHIALSYAATGLFRGAGYVSFRGEQPRDAEHAAIAAPYAHVTAPLRRLVDRWGLVMCAHLVAGSPVPTWVIESMDELPSWMMAAARRASAVERACVDAVEVAMVADRVGQELSGIAVAPKGADAVLVHVDDPALVVKAKGQVEMGQRVRIRVDSADLSQLEAQFSIVG